MKLVILIWIYANKFDKDGFFINFKAKLIAKGDLYYLEEETYIATLVALITAFNLKTRQYNAVIAFVNAKFKKLILV